MNTIVVGYDETDGSDRARGLVELVRRVSRRALEPPE